jgi:hypothetical protein
MDCIFDIVMHLDINKKVVMYEMKIALFFHFHFFYLFVDLCLILLLSDVLTTNTRKTYMFSQVNKIPETFKSATDYKNSFIPLLFEETRTDLSSSLSGVSRAPFCEIKKVTNSKQLQLPKAQKHFKQFRHNIQ